MANFDNIIQEINTNLPDNNTQSITAAKLRTTLIDLTTQIDTVQDDFENSTTEYIETHTAFKTNENLADTGIDDSCSDASSTDVASANVVMEIAQDCRETKISETKMTPYSVESGKRVSATTGLLTNYSNFTSYIYDVSGYEYFRFLSTFGTLFESPSGYAFTDENDDLSTSTAENTIWANNMRRDEEKFGKIPSGAKWLKISVLNSNSSGFYCYCGNGTSQNTFVDKKLGECGSSYEINFDEYGYNIAGIASTGQWSYLASQPSVNKLIPIGNNVKSITIVASEQNNTLYQFLKSERKATRTTPDYAEGVPIGYLTVASGTTETIQVPNEANFLFIQNNSSYNRTPKHIYFNTVGITNFDYRRYMSVSSVIDNTYISNDGTYSLVPNDNYKINVYDVTNVSCVGIYGRIANAGCGVFYDINDNIVGTVLGKYSTSSSEYNINDVVVVPKNAVTFKVSFAKSVITFVTDCSNMGYESQPRNMLTAKKVSFVGDSITYGYGLTNQSDRWTTVFSRNYARCLENNLGVSGSCLCSNTKNRTTYEDPVNADRFITRVTQDTIGDSDVIFIWGGTNDFSYDSKAIGDLFVEEDITGNQYIGTKKRVAPTDTDTFSGALHELLSTVRTINPDAKVIYLNIMNRGVYSGWASNAKRPTSFQQNANGNWLTDYNEAIKTICAFYAVPVLDIHSLINQNWAYDDGTYESLDLDGIHPNKAGHKRIAEIVFNYVTYNHLV